jgi:hypothetical protein
VLYQVAAELVVVLYLGFVIAGGVAIHTWPRIVWVHAPMFV